MHVVRVIVCVQPVMHKQENVPNVKEDINYHVEVVLSVELERILQEEQRRHAQIVELEKVVLLEHHLVQHVQQEHTDQQQQTVNVQLVLLENIRQLEQKNALIV